MSDNVNKSSSVPEVSQGTAVRGLAINETENIRRSNSLDTLPSQALVADIETAENQGVAKNIAENSRSAKKTISTKSLKLAKDSLHEIRQLWLRKDQKTFTSACNLTIEKDYLPAASASVGQLDQRRKNQESLNRSESEGNMMRKEVAPSLRKISKKTSTKKVHIVENNQ